LAQGRRALHGSQKKPAKEGEVDLFEDFTKKYAKNQREFDTPRIAEVQDYVTRIVDDGEEVPSWNFTKEFDPMAFRILFHSMHQSGLATIRALRVWKCNGGDESVRSVCYYLDSNPPPAVEDLQFIDNGVTELGCGFLGRTLGPNGNSVVNLLRLDFNMFGTAGVKQLSLGLSQNSTLRHLSLQYCGITEDGGEHIAHILMYFKSSLEILDLRGNYLGTGIVDVFHGCRRSKLRKIDVFDNKFTDTPEVVATLRDLFAVNTKLESYNLGGNHISDAGARHLIQGMLGHTHLKEVLVPERCKGETFEALEFQLGASKGKKKGKKGKKK